jgi:molybdopterin converting factor small subunit
MKVSVLLFGPAAALVNARQITVETAPGASVAALRRAIVEQYARLTDLVSAGRLAVNSAFLPESTTLSPDDEVALIALVSGG